MGLINYIYIYKETFHGFISSRAEGVVVQAAVAATGDLADALDKRQSSC